MDNLRRFIVIITVFLFFATSICGFLLSLGYSGISKGKETDVTIDATPFNPDEQTPTVFKGNILVIVGEKSRPETDLMFVINYDSNTSKLSFLYIPKDLKYSDPVKQETGTIGTYYSHNGGEATTLLVSSILDIGITYYINLNDNAFARMINMFEAVNYSLPVNIKYKDQYYDIDIQKGEHLFDGAMALQLIQFYKTQDNVYSSSMLNFYNGKDVNRIKIASNFMNAFVLQKFGENGKDKYNYYELFELLLPDCETNINKEVLKNITSKLDKLNTGLTENYMITGKEVLGLKYFIEYKDIFKDFKTGLDVDAKGILKDKFYS